MTGREKEIIRCIDKIVQDGIFYLRETVLQLKNENGKKPLKSSLQEIIDTISINGLQ